MTASPRAPCPAWARPKADAPPLGKLLLPHSLSEVCHGGCQCVCLGSDAILFPVSVSRFPSVSGSVSPSLCLCLRVCVSVCVVCARTRVCLPLAIFESVSEPLSLSDSVFADTGPSIPSSAPGFSQVL